jgi:hypothetical protein
MKRKICVYVTEELATRLAAAARERGATKSGLVEVALDRFLSATDQHDERASLERRLTWMSRQLEQLDRDLRIVNETAAMHARFHLAVTPPLPKAAQQAACTAGSARFEEFAAQVGRRVHLGKPLMRETLDRLSVTSPHLFATENGDALPFGAPSNPIEPATADTIPSTSISADKASERPAVAREVGSNDIFPRETNRPAH